MKYESQICENCGQTTDYILAIDRGTVDIVRAIDNAVRTKGINEVHPRKEMEVATRDAINYVDLIADGRLTSNQINNLSRPRSHGLIARIRGKSGYYCLTRKGAAFLRGEEIPRVAIVSRAEGKQIGYFEPEMLKVKISDFTPVDEYWAKGGLQINEDSN